MPEKTLKIVSRPANGSAMVLNTWAEKGASGVGSLSVISFDLGSVPTRGAMSQGAGNRSFIMFNRSSVPLLPVAAVTQTGQSSPDLMPFFKPITISSLPNSPSSRNFSMSSSSVSATCSMRLSRYTAISSAISAGISVSVALPLSSNR